jgi:hypothetical protein
MQHIVMTYFDGEKNAGLLLIAIGAIDGALLLALERSPR